MQVSRKLPQFSGRAALLIVAGKQVAEFYLAQDGQIRRLNSFQIATPKYSDREGFFITRNHQAGIMRSGAPYEAKEQKIRQDFLREFAQNLRLIEAGTGVDEIYLFSPAEVLLAKLPKSLAGKVAGEFRGNFYGSHPFVLLQEIAKARPSKRRPVQITAEARKILERTGSVQISRKSMARRTP